MRYALTNCVIYTKYDVLRDFAVIINGEIIEAVVPQAELETGIKTIDLQGNNLTAGFIDLQLNGCGGVMFNDQTSVETLEILKDRLSALRKKVYTVPNIFVKLRLK